MGLLREKIVQSGRTIQKKNCGRDNQEQAVERRARQNTMGSCKLDSKSV